MRVCKRALWAFVLLLACSLFFWTSWREKTISASAWSVKHEQHELTLSLSTRGFLRFAVGKLFRGKMGLKITDIQSDFDADLSFVRDSGRKRISETYEMPHGKSRQHQVEAEERTVTFSNRDGRQMTITLRAHSDGVAFRYSLLASPRAQNVVVLKELTFWKLPFKAWLQPHQEPAMFQPAYESYYEDGLVQDQREEIHYSMPALFRLPDGYLLLAEAGPFRGEYCGSHLLRRAHSNFEISFPHPNEGNRVGKVTPESSSALEWTMPWRVMIMASNAAKLLESDLVNDLAPASPLALLPPWIRGGRAAWSWWSDPWSPRNADKLIESIDFAADFHFEFCLIDANWNTIDFKDFARVVERAREKRVGLFLWYNSGGPHNGVSEQPRDLMHSSETRRVEMLRIQKLGIVGIKVDFWHSDKQERMRGYYELLEDAGAAGLLVTLHGCTVPRGWERTHPHLVTMEAVAGAENLNNRPEHPEKAARQNSILPFTRNVVGSMDYTPVTFSNGKFARRTTRAHELATAVIFLTGVQHFADSASSYRGLSAGIRQLLMRVPVVWDETRGLLGEVGEHVVVARRRGKEWWVAGISVAATTLEIPLGSIASSEHAMQLWTDATFDQEEVDSVHLFPGQSLRVNIDENGGFLAVIEPRK